MSRSCLVPINRATTRSTTCSILMLALLDAPCPVPAASTCRRDWRQIRVAGGKTQFRSPREASDAAASLLDELQELGS